MNGVDEAGRAGARPGGRPRISWLRSAPPWLVQIELRLAQGLLAFGIIIVPYFNVTLPRAGWVGASALLALGLALFWALAWRGEVRQLVGLGLARVERLGAAQTMALGVVLTGATGLLTQPTLVSDPEVYVALADGLVNELRYRDPDGRLAFWPPAFPFFLTPFVALLGPGLAAIVTANAVLCLVSMLSLYSLTARLVGPSFALRAALLFAVWPARLLVAGVASKECLTMAAVLLALALLAYGMAFASRRGLVASAGAGACFGVAALAQPGLLLLALATPLMFWQALARLGPLRWAARVTLVIALAYATIAPWQMRNCIVFDGRFCGVATNGGWVFYRANNPLATGAWTAEGEVPMAAMNEVDQNRLGFELGARWIREHPLDFARLAGKKLMLLFGSDDLGAYWGIRSGGGELNVAAGSARDSAYKAASRLSLVFWVLILAAAFSGLRGVTSRAMSDDAAAQFRPLVYPLLYSSAVFAVFESASRQHMVAAAVLLAVAATGLRANRSTSAA